MLVAVRPEGSSRIIMEIEVVGARLIEAASNTSRRGAPCASRAVDDGDIVECTDMTARATRRGRTQFARHALSIA